jgi:hypothetical protein
MLDIYYDDHSIYSKLIVDSLLAIEVFCFYYSTILHFNSKLLGLIYVKVISTIKVIIVLVKNLLYSNLLSYWL